MANEEVVDEEAIMAVDEATIKGAVDTADHNTENLIVYPSIKRAWRLRKSKRSW